MDETAVELAKVTLDVYASELSPTYAGIRDRLVGQLAMNDMQLGDLRAQETLRRNNYTLVTEFVGMLPQSSNPLPSSGRFGASIETEDPYTARQVDAHVLWINVRDSYDSKYGTFVPFYIIGQRPAPPEPYERDTATPRVELLLCSANPRGAGDITVATVWEHEFEIVRTNAQQAMYKEFTPAELRQRFNPDTGNLRVWPHETAMRTALSGTHLAKPLKRKSTPQKILENGMQVSFHDYRFRDVKTLEDRDLANFDVFTYLNNLATAFGKVDHLHELLDKYKAEIPNDPVEDILNS